MLFVAYFWSIFCIGWSKGNHDDGIASQTQTIQIQMIHETKLDKFPITPGHDLF
tara:strand:+ start:307 stop:468 length:162 start_codon:yes stop_codon:yes gene_type:complete